MYKKSVESKCVKLIGFIARLTQHNTIQYNTISLFSIKHIQDAHGLQQHIYSGGDITAMTNMLTEGHTQLLKVKAMCNAIVKLCITQLSGFECQIDKFY